MKLFDLHADIGYSVMQERRRGNHDTIQQIHLPKRKLGEFEWVCMASYFEGNETWQDMQEMVLALKEDIATCEEVVLVHDAKDLDKHGMKAILTIEGMCGISSDVAQRIDWLSEQGIKIASLTWNDENALATGARGNPKRGLSELGIQAIHQMEKRNMIIDVSHANETTFWDLMHHSDGAIIATHSNVRSLCDHVRNLKDEQLLAIAKRGGLIGVVTAGFFVSKQRMDQDIQHLIQHIGYLKDLVGIDAIALGLDYMDDFEHCSEDMLTDLSHPSDSQKLIEALRTNGFQEQEIRKIAYENAVNFMKRHLDESF